MNIKNKIITEDIIQIEKYINNAWPKFITKKEVKLSYLFYEPDNKWLKHIWAYGSADLVIYFNNKPICIIETGGGQHFEEKQSINDRNKAKLSEINNVRCLQMTTRIIDKLSKRKWRNLLGRYIFGC